MLADVQRESVASVQRGCGAIVLGIGLGLAVLAAAAIGLIRAAPSCPPDEMCEGRPLGIFLLRHAVAGGGLLALSGWLLRLHARASRASDHSDQ